MRLLRNSAYCKKCKTHIQSRNTHEYTTCKCGEVSVDGGQDYARRVFWDKTAYTETSVYDNGDHNLRSSMLKWGVTSTKDGKKLPQTQFKQIRLLDTEHIKAILKTQRNMDSFYREVMIDELEYRGEL